MHFPAENHPCKEISSNQDAFLRWKSSLHRIFFKSGCISPPKIIPAQDFLRIRMHFSAESLLCLHKELFPFPGNLARSLTGSIPGSLTGSIPGTLPTSAVPAIEHGQSHHEQAICKSSSEIDGHPDFSGIQFFRKELIHMLGEIQVAQVQGEAVFTKEGREPMKPLAVPQNRLQAKT